MGIFWGGVIAIPETGMQNRCHEKFHYTCLRDGVGSYKRLARAPRRGNLLCPQDQGLNISRHRIRK